MNTKVELPKTVIGLLTLISDALCELESTHQVSIPTELPNTGREKAPRKHGASASLIPLDQEMRTTLPTREAAYHLGRQEQTLRIWACRGTGVVRPLRINGRLAWPVDAIRKVLGVSE